MMWFRVDNRLIHGQVIESWLPYLGASRLVVCSPALAGDLLQQQIMQLAVPSRVKVDFVSFEGLAALYGRDTPQNKTLALFADCADARSAYGQGVRFATLNVGNLHYAPGKTQICPHVALSEDDKACFSFFRDDGVSFDFRCVPGDKTQVRNWL
jgi:PTS system mannose-specific IIB component